MKKLNFEKKAILNTKFGSNVFFNFGWRFFPEAIFKFFFWFFKKGTFLSILNRLGRTWVGGRTEFGGAALAHWKIVVYIAIHLIVDRLQNECTQRSQCHQQSHHLLNDFFNTKIFVWTFFENIFKEISRWTIFTE